MFLFNVLLSHLLEPHLTLSVCPVQQKALFAS